MRRLEYVCQTRLAARVRSDLLELKSAAIRRELIPAGDIERAWSDVLRGVRARMMQVPGRLQAAHPGRGGCGAGSPGGARRGRRGGAQ